jgi:hypothetical protein
METKSCINVTIWDTEVVRCLSVVDGMLSVLSAQ